MKRFARLPLAAVCLGAGALGGMLFQDRLTGQVPAPPAVVMPRELSSYREVVKRVVPAVVSIEAKSTKKPATANAPRPRRLPPGVPEEFRRFFDDGAEPEPRTEPNLGFGSGVLIDAAGVILTNFHVVEGADQLEIQLQDGRKFTSGDIRRDPKTDLAVVLIKVEQPLPFLAFGDSDLMEVGDRVLAVGAPFGLTGSVTQGIISAKSRQNLKLNQYEDFLQTDAAMNPGNSGGPLVSLEGQIIGINSAIKTRGGGSNGVGLAVSSNLAKDVARQLRNDGTVRRGYLGVSIRELDAELAARMGVPAMTTGALVSKVQENTPAAKAGLQSGDVILSIGGVAIKEAGSLPRLVSRLPLGKPTEIVFVRDGKTTAQLITIEEQPQEYGLATGTERTPRGVAPRANPEAAVEIAGLSIGDLTPALANSWGYPRETQGALILGVERGSAAANAGLTRGLVIVKVDQSPVANAREFQTAMANVMKDKGALLQLLRPNGESDFLVLKVK